jgi:sialic acid synthase SpsE
MVYIIAECGMAHLGSQDLAELMLDTALSAGADAFKIQAFDPFNAQKVYSGPRKASRALSQASIYELRNMCHKADIDFIITPHDEWAMITTAQVRPDYIKMGSGEKGNWKAFEKAASLNIPLIVSVGGYHHVEIDEMYEATGDCVKHLLHCVGQYPCPPAEAQLDRIDFLREKFGEYSKIGYSDHTTDADVVNNAVYKHGAECVEMHMKLVDHPTSGDSRVGLLPSVFHARVDMLRSLEK